MKPNMLKRDYGIFLLDNADRDSYDDSAIPAHWLVVSFENGIDETTIWMACPTKFDAHCLRAKKNIHSLLSQIPDSVGKRYTKRAGAWD